MIFFDVIVLFKYALRALVILVGECGGLVGLIYEIPEYTELE